MIKELMEKRNITKQELAKATNIPYSTICDLVTGKVTLPKTSAANLYKLAQFFNLSMESIIEPEVIVRKDFEWFKSSERHKLKEIGDFEYILEIVKNNFIARYWGSGWHLEALYLLGMLDYLCRINDLPLFPEYDNIRDSKMDTMIYPLDAVLLDKVYECSRDREKSTQLSIPEFIRHNIVEVEVRDIA